MAALKARARKVAQKVKPVWTPEQAAALEELRKAIVEAAFQRIVERERRR